MGTKDRFSLNGYGRSFSHMTSWGRILKFPTPDPALMKQFVQRNRYQAPEPNAA
jgi:hypothetical protein